MKLKQELGAEGELIISSLLKKQGFSIVTRNYRKSFGEVDIIASKGELLVFVEVKARRHVSFPIALVVTERKQRKIVKMAQYFLMENCIENKVCRFDVATVLYKSATEYDIDYRENAFCSR